jgi:hypothetical protein
VQWKYIPLPRYPTHNVLRSAPKVVCSGNDSPSPFGRRSQLRFLSAQDRPGLGPTTAHIRPRWSCGTAGCHRSAETREVSENGPDFEIKRESEYARIRKTYTDGDGVVPSKVIPDVMILELLHRSASARIRRPHSDETEEQRRETHKRLDVRQISMQVRRASTTSFASSSRNVACPSRSGSQLNSSFVSAAEFPLVCSVSIP